MAKICVWGDSIAWGHSDNEREGWVNRLRHYFYNAPNKKFRVYNLGVSGAITSDLLERFEVECKARKPEIIIFAIGINDSRYIKTKGSEEISLEEFEENIEKIIKEAKKYTQKIIFVGLTKFVESKAAPIAWDEVKYYYNKNVKLYDEKLKETALNNNLHYIYMFDLIEDKELEDGLHPNSKGHQKMFEKVKNFLEQNKV
ncbi:MAG: SGNH/GDSL hydrolase family protein [Candidatus Woesearchaeota archaeon]